MKSETKTQTHPYHLPDKNVEYHFFKSFGYAWQGIKLAFSRETNLSIQVGIGFTFAMLGIVYGRWTSAMANIILMSIVISLEMLNTAFETLCDLVHPEYHIKIKIIKDMAAGAVLITASAWLLVILYQILTIFVITNTTGLNR